MDAKLKYLEFIQAIITRMNSNSFMLKGWCITLVSALFALAAKDANQLFVLIAYIPLPAFWLLDGYYLSQERQYRELYNTAIKSDPTSVGFSMNVKQYAIGRNTWLLTLFSPTILLFYGVATSTILVVLLIVRGWPHG